MKIYSLVLTCLLAFSAVYGLTYAQPLFAKEPAAHPSCLSIISESKHIASAPNRALKPAELRNLALNLARGHGHEILESLKDVRPASDGRAYRKVYEDANLTAWAIQWNGQCTEIHDHVLSQAGIAVLDGHISEQVFKLNKTYSNGEPKPRIIHTGRGIALKGTPYVHRICGNGVSLHIYSPRLSEMTIYDLSPARILVPRGTELDNDP